MSKKVIVTGATGQTGSYMVEYLLKNTQNTVICAVRRTSQAILSNLKDVLDNPRVKLVNMDLCDPHSIDHVIQTEKPDFLLNFGAASFVADSWQNPALYFQQNAISLIHILESVRKHVPFCRVYSAGSSEQWGDVKYSPQDEKHPMSPRSPYGATKCAAGLIAKVWRESYGLYVVHGILLNHESERRQEYFVTRKITKAVARIKKYMDQGKNFEPLTLGNIRTKRDWSHAEDFVGGVWMMMNQDIFREQEVGQRSEKWHALCKEKNLIIGSMGLAHYTESELKDYYESLIKAYHVFLSQNIQEYVLSSNETHEVKEFVEKAFAVAGISGRWHNIQPDNPLTEEFILCEKNGLATKEKIVLMAVDSQFFRLAEVDLLWGDSTKARQELGWTPKVSFDQLVRRMTENDLNNP